ncbi:MAG: hypothetical protein LUQ54_06815 [Methanoregula sp.]|nr:hypothetical protein [Methanoregula sp.]
MDDYIQCDLMDARGPAWEEHSTAQINKLVKLIHADMSLIGTEPNMYGFVGTRTEKKVGASEIVGGYFAVQYADKEFLYDKKKKLNIIPITPFARMFFVFFARSGKCLLQNTRFTGIPLTYTIAKSRFQLALNQAFNTCEMGKLSSLAFARTERSNSAFTAQLKRSLRISRVKIATPSTRRLPGNIKYYNPKVERNEIIRLSHEHDYQYLKSIEFEVKDDADIRNLHIKDAMRSGQTEEMDFYTKDEEKITLRRKVINKFIFKVDMEAEELPQKQFTSVLQEIRQAGAVL